jgi:signal transduction histidine kinase
MVSVSGFSLTKIGFRRDVRIFLGVLVGYLVFVILVLLLVWQNSVITLSQTFDANRGAVARVIAREIDALDVPDPGIVQTILTRERETFGLLGLKLKRPGGFVIRSGFQDAIQSRESGIETRFGRLTIYFDESVPRAERKRFTIIAFISLLGTVAVTILLLLYLPRIVQPIEAMLDHASEIEDKAAGADEANYLVETFRKTVETLKAQQEELARLHDAERSRADELGQIAAGIAHEFRNSLATVLGYLRLAKREGLTAEATSRIDLAESEAKLLAQAVDRLLGFARPIAPELHPTPLRPMLEEIAARLRDDAAPITIAVSGDDGATARADSALLRVVFENLIRNAIDSVRRRESGEGSVAITVIAAPRPAVTIADDGVGFDPAEAARLFLPFQSDRPGGFGLGLAIARKIVILHDGDITLTGEPGLGATARVELPSA